MSRSKIRFSVVAGTMAPLLITAVLVAGIAMHGAREGAALP